MVTTGSSDPLMSSYIDWETSVSGVALEKAICHLSVFSIDFAARAVANSISKLASCISSTRISVFSSCQSLENCSSFFVNVAGVMKQSLVSGVASVARPRILPTKWLGYCSPSCSRKLFSTYSVTLSTITRRGINTTTRSNRSSAYWAVCVVLPLPVGPHSQDILLSDNVSNISALCLYAGSFLSPRS